MTNSATHAIAALPLKEMEASLLRSAILAEVARLGLDTPTFEEALDVASYLHRDQTRKQRGSMPLVHYIEHPLRNTLRALRYGVVDTDTLLAVILHDTVEDNPFEMASVFGGVTTDSEAAARAAALAFVDARFGHGVAVTVLGLSNPLGDDKRSRAEKNAAYVAHVESAIGSARVFVAKFVDFADNALSLQHSSETGYAHRQAVKYLPLVPLFEARLDEPDVELLVGPGVVAHMREALDGNRLASL